MPLMKGHSKQAFSKNVKTEMEAGKPMKQSLAIAYGVKRKKKASGGTVKSGSETMNYAKGGSVSAKTESRPMPTSPNQEQVSRNMGDKAPKNDNWTSNITVSQAQKPSKTPLSQPKMAAITGPFSVRSRDMHEDEADMMDKMPPETDRAMPPMRDNEDEAIEEGSSPDMADQHNDHKKPYNVEVEHDDEMDEADSDMKKTQSYAEGGEINDFEPMSAAEDDELDEPHGLESDNDEMSMPVDEYMAGHFAEGGMAHDMDDQPHDEEEMEHAADIASAIMAARRTRMAEGGDIHSKGSWDTHEDVDQADLSRNADEDANEEDQMSFGALRKENYSESAGLRQLDSPRDSNEYGDSEESESENDHDKDMVSRIMSKMKKRSAITR